MYDSGMGEGSMVGSTWSYIGGDDLGAVSALGEEVGGMWEAGEAV